MSLEFEYQETSIVVRGPFAPAMFHPSWFANHNLIRASEADSAKIESLRHTGTRFRAEWLWVEVDPNRIQLRIESDLYNEPLRDLGIGLFTLLDTIPATALGINRGFIFDLQSENAWHDLGHRLTPKGHWEFILNSPGMLGLAMQGKKANTQEGYYQVKIQSHRGIVDFGVSIDVNDHYALKAETEDEDMIERSVKDVLSHNWEQSLAHSLEVARKVVHFALEH